MIWHELPELPKPDTEVLAELSGDWNQYTGCKYAIVRLHLGTWNIFCPNGRPQGDRWLTMNVLSIKRWAYIEEEEI